MNCNLFSGGIDANLELTWIAVSHYTSLITVCRSTTSTWQTVNPKKAAVVAETSTVT